MKENIIKGSATAALAALGAYCGELMIPLAVLLAAMIADYISGMAKAWTTAQLSSRVGILGIVKKLSYLLIVCAGMGVDWVIATAATAAGIDLGVTYFVALLVIIWLVINELLSIVENVAAMGVHVPKFLLKLIGHIKNRVEDKADTGDDGDDTTV